jgi:hypothetical protein
MLVRLDPASLSPRGESLGERLRSVQRGGASHPQLHPELYAHFEAIGYYGIRAADTLQRHLETDACVHVCNTDGSPEARAIGSLLQAEDERHSWTAVRGDADADQQREAASEIQRLDQKKVEAVRSLASSSESLSPSVDRLLLRERTHITVVDQLKALATDARLPEDIRNFCAGVETAPRSTLHDGIKAARSSLRRSAHADLKGVFAKVEADYERLDRPGSSLGSALYRAVKGVHLAVEELDRYRDIPEWRSHRVNRYLEQVRALLGPDAPRNFEPQIDGAVLELNKVLEKSRGTEPSRDIDMAEGR